MIHNLLKMMKEVSHNSGGENVRFGAGLPRSNDGSPLWAWMGAMGVAAVNGIVSPAYNVYQPGDRLDRPGCLGMNALQPWSGFDRLVDALAAVQVKSRDTVRIGLATAKGWSMHWPQRSRAGACRGSRGGISETTARSRRPGPAWEFARRSPANLACPSRSGRRCLPNCCP